MQVKSISIIAFVFLLSCSTKIDPGTYAEVQQKGREIAGVAQTTLLKNVGAAIQKGGTEYAVEFCNLEAGGIVADLNEQYNCSITRVSAKNRNSENALESEQEKMLWKIFQNGAVIDTIVKGGQQELVYYKAINIGMPACLKCHGDPQTDINEATQQKLQRLYPNDLATGYQLNDFRGLWKIVFER